MKIAGARAVVTGAGHGIGRAVALELAARGAGVAVVDLEAEPAREVAAEVEAAGGEAVSRAVDVADAEAMETLANELFATFGPIRLLVNNAGVNPTAPVLESSPATFDWVFGVNVKGVHNGCRSFGRRFVEHHEPAWIVNVGSEHSLGVPHLGAGLYTATKHAVLGLSDVLRRELPDHVGVSVLLPGLTQSTLWQSEARRQAPFGGPSEPDPAAARVMAEGMPAADVARRLADGVEAEAFLIPTHAHVVRYGQRRWEEIHDAFAARAPRHDGDEAFAVGNVLRRLRDER